MVEGPGSVDAAAYHEVGHFIVLAIQGASTWSIARAATGDSRSLLGASIWTQWQCRDCGYARRGWTRHVQLIAPRCESRSDDGVEERNGLRLSESHAFVACGSACCTVTRSSRMVGQAVRQCGHPAPRRRIRYGRTL